MAGKFMTLEGIDGAGKSSHLAFIADRLTGLGHQTLTTREPGGTPLSEALRTILLNEKMHGETEALLMFAARREQLLETIAPSLKKGVWVVCDRYTDSTYAYQCGGRGMPESRVAILEQWVHGELQPDLTFLFDAPLDIARERVKNGTEHPDKFEREQQEFFSNVRGAYLKRAMQFPERIKVINSARSLGEIQTELAWHIDMLGAKI